MTATRPLGATPHGGAFELTSPKPRLRGVSSARPGYLGLAGLLVTCLLLSLAAANSDLLLPASVRLLRLRLPVPEWLAGAFGGVGLHLGLFALIALFTLMFFSYALALRSVERLSGRAVLMTIAALNALVLLAPPLISTDMFSYVAYGRMVATYGANPYVLGPSAIALDPLYPFIGAQWVSTPTAYGPLFTALSYPLAHLDLAANVIAYKAIAAISSLVIVGGVWNAARLRGLDPVKAVALVGLNPVLVVYGVGGGHNDLLMLALLVAGVYVLLGHRPRTSGALLVAATAVKLTAAVVLPFAIAGHQRESRGRSGLIISAAVASVLFGVLAFVLFGTGPLHLFGTLQKIQREGGLHSVTGFIFQLLGIGQIGTVAGLVMDVGLVVTVAWLVRRVWLGQLDWISGAGWATVALLLTAGLLLPWYIAWLLPLTALSTDRRLWLATALLTGVMLTTL
jgi:hypothetical protein